MTEIRVYLDGNPLIQSTVEAEEFVCFFCGAVDNLDWCEWCGQWECPDESCCPDCGGAPPCGYH